MKKHDLRNTPQQNKPMLPDDHTTHPQPLVAPSYYTDTQLEPWDVAIDWLSADGYRGGLIMAILKYLKRYSQKDGVRDLYKANEYLKELIRFEERQRFNEDMCIDAEKEPLS